MCHQPKGGSTVLPGICAQLKPRVSPNECPGLSNGVALSGAQHCHLPTRGKTLMTLKILSELMFWDPKCPPQNMARNTHIGLSFPSLGLSRTNGWGRRTLSVTHYGMAVRIGKRAVPSEADSRNAKALQSNSPVQYWNPSGSSQPVHLPLCSHTSQNRDTLPPEAEPSVLSRSRAKLSFF